MAMVTPPSGAQVKGTPPEQSQDAGGGAEEAMESIQQGFQKIGALIQQAGQGIDPQDVKLFQAAAQAFDNFSQAISSGGEGDQSAPPPPKSGPMPPNANANAKPMPNQEM